MTKQKQLSNEFDVLHLRENNPWVRGAQRSGAVEHSCRGIFGQEPAEEATRKQRDWPGDGNFLLRLAGPIF